MRLDHLLSKRDEVKVVLLLSCQGTDRAFVSKRRRGREALGEAAEQFSMSFVAQKIIFPVPMRLWDTPVPIPNTMVKT